MNKFYKLALSAIVVGLSFTSCKKEDTSKGAYENGIFIINEGGFNNGNASVSFIAEDGIVQQGIFKATNGRDLGDTFQSMFIKDNKGFLVLNNSDKVEIVDVNTFKEEGVISDLNSPRYMTSAAGKLYLSQWNGWGEKGSVQVIDPSTYKVESTIEVGVAPEGVLKVGNRVWVANSTDNTISILNTDLDKVAFTLNLQNAESPKQMVLDEDGDVWVLCSGSAVYDYNPPYSLISETSSYLVEFNPSTKEVKSRIELSENQHYSSLSINDSGNVLYYGAGYGTNGIFKIRISDTYAPSVPLIKGSFYGFNVDKSGFIYGCIAPSFKEAGTVKKYYATTGEVVTSYVAGIGPNGVVFNN